MAQKDERRSELAKRLHSEPHPSDPARRKFGGPQPGSGRPRVKRASTRAAEAAAAHADKIIDAFRRGVESQDERTAVMAAEKWVTLERQEAALQIEEARALEEMTRADLIDMLATGMSKLDDAGVIDGTAVDVEQHAAPAEDEGINPFMALGDEA